jgi:CheY-like chemotaxis protein
MMPGMDCFEVLDAMRREATWREIPVLVLPAKDLNAEEVTWLNQHAERVLRMRPISDPNLLASFTTQSGEVRKQAFHAD